MRLLQSGLINPKDLARKYANELYATEIMLLAYYVAAVNIETTFNALQAEAAARNGEPEPGYVPFEGIALADTFQIHEEDDTLDLGVFADNSERIEHQKATPIHVIVGNPPYSAGQTSANDNNANVKYPSLDRRIEETYAAKSTATNKNSLYDSYLRAFRWATDRIGDHGIVAFVSNGGWIDGNTGDGVRLSMQEDFSELYVFNLRGNQRTAGEQSRREGGKVFGSGSRATIAITIGIKDSRETGDCRIHYRDIGDYLTAEEKLEIVDNSSIPTIEWETIVPNTYGDWVNQRSEEFETWPVLGDKRSDAVPRFFSNYSAGLQTNRDAWVYNFSKEEVEKNINRLVDGYNNARVEFIDSSFSGDHERDVTEFLKANPEYADERKIKWSRSLRNSAAKNISIEISRDGLVEAMYRPFTRQNVYFDRYLNHERGQQPYFFPTAKHDNVGFYIPAASSAARGFNALATSLLPDLCLSGSGSGQFFPRWTWEPIEAPEGQLDLSATVAVSGDKGSEGEVLDGYRRVDNVTDEIHALYRETLGEDVTKDDIFYFVYGKLHDPVYRKTHEADLKKMLPHIETPKQRTQFNRFVAAGKKLMDLHIHYEDVEPYPLEVQVKRDPEDRETWRVLKMKWAKKKDPETGKSINDVTKLIYNKYVTVAGIPEEVDEYMLGSRSALAWLIDRYQVRPDKKSGIINDPNDWADEVGNPRYIVDLIGKVTRVAVETMQIVNGLRSIS